MESSINFAEIEKKVFFKDEKTGAVTIGGQIIPQQMRDILREQAKYIQTSNFFEILDATITNEAADLALIQSANFSHVECAKMLHHWNHVLKKMIVVLAK